MAEEKDVTEADSPVVVPCDCIEELLDPNGIDPSDDESVKDEDHDAETREEFCEGLEKKDEEDAAPDRVPPGEDGTPTEGFCKEPEGTCEEELCEGPERAEVNEFIKVLGATVVTVTMLLLGDCVEV